MLLGVAQKVQHLSPHAGLASGFLSGKPTTLHHRIVTRPMGLEPALAGPKFGERGDSQIAMRRLDLGSMRGAVRT